MQKARISPLLAGLFAFLIISSLNLAYTRATGLTMGTGDAIHVNADSITIEGDVVNSGTVETTTGTINLDGNWSNSGTFNAGSLGLVAFTGSGVSTITGANTFFNLNCFQGGKRLNFEAGKTQTVSGTLSLTGTVGNHILLRSATDGAQWTINPITNSIFFVDVKDSINIGPTVINPPDSIDSGNNINWFTVAATPTPSPTPMPDGTVTPTPTPTPSPTATPDGTVTPTPSPSPTPSPGLPTPTPSPTPTPEIKAPTAEFRADPVSGFADLTVKFTDESTNKPTSWAWDFGDGHSSKDQNPTNTYTKSGNFTVKLIVSNSADSDEETKINLIVVPELPDCTAAFNADKTIGVAPFEVKFTDKSTGNPKSWAWDFGDGGSSKEQHPKYTYKNEGVFTVKLEVSADCGAVDFKQVNLITVKAEVMPPIAEFNANPTSGFAPLDVQFNNLSTGEPTSFVWKFGDGGSSSEESPKHTYKTAGIFTVSLLTSNSSGADFESKTNLINVLGGEAPRADFNGNPLTGFAPLRVEFADLSSGNISSWAWTQGDATTSNLKDHVHEYQSPGIYNVELTVSSEDGSGVENKTGFINVLEGEGPTANFMAEPLIGNAPFTVHFFDISSNAANHSWEFGDGDVSQEKNPVHTYKTPGVFSVKLTVSSKDGTDIENKTNLIIAQNGGDPTAGFSVNKQSLDDELESVIGNRLPVISKGGSDASIVGITAENGENEFTVKFNDISSSPDDNIVNREWDFGDGSPKSADKNPEHTYRGTKDEAFTVSLAVQNSKGIDTVTKPAFVAMSGGIVPGFIKGKVIEQNSKAAIVGAKIAVKNGDVEIAEVFTPNDGAFFLQVPDGELTLMASKEGFRDALKKVKAVVNKTVTLNIEMVGVDDPDDPLKADFSADITSGPAPLNVQFTDKSEGSPAKWEWNFGDRGVSFDQNPSHVYTKKGKYTVTLTVSNDSGKNTVKKKKFINAKNGCAASAVMDDISALDALRLFRDNVMTKTTTGLKLIVLYYKYSDEVVEILESNPALKSRASGVLAGLVGTLRHNANSASTTQVVNNSIDGSLANEVNALLDDIGERGSSELKAAINNAKGLVYGK